MPRANNPLFVVMALGIGASASASFELALIMDDANDQILRYDPVNKIQLGAFGRGQLGEWSNANGLALDPTNNNLVAALDIDGNVRWFNYNTGIYVRGVATGDINEYGYQNFKILSDGNLLITADYAGTRRTRVFNGTTGALISTFTDYTGSGYTTLDCVAASDGTYYSLERTGAGTYFYHLFRRNATGGFLSGLFSYASSADSDFQKEIEISGSRILTLGRKSESLLGFTVSGSTITQNAVGYSLVPGYFASGLSFGHGGRAHFTQYRSGTPDNWYYTFDPLSVSYHAYGGEMPYTQNMGGMVLVTAPEPGTMAVLGLGALALLKRRRAR